MADAAAAGAQVTDDAFLGERLNILQPRKGPRAGIDPLFLAAAVEAPAGRTIRVIEAGSGTGVASLALARRLPNAHCLGIELDTDMRALAAQNAARNGLSDRVRFLTGDVTSREPVEPPELAADVGQFDYAIANPPFHTLGRERASGEPKSRLAHIAEQGSLELWVGFLMRMVRPKGQIVVIHKPEALSDLLQALPQDAGAIDVFPLFARPRGPARRVVIRARRSSRTPTRLFPGLVLHREDGGYSEPAEAVLRGACGLRWDP